MNAQRTIAGRGAPRRGFTLVELLVVIMIISILASTVLFTMYQAVQQAKEARAQTQVTKLHDLLMTRWEAYRTRPVRLLQVSAPGTPVQPVSVSAQVRRDARAIATGRLNALRDLMRMEMPDRRSDVIDDPASHVLTYFIRTPAGPIPGNPPVTVTIKRPSLSWEYRRRANTNTGGNLNNWTTTHQGAECLYLIVASIRDITGNGLDVLQEGEVGDVDDDDMLEILDPWGNPIEFLRWAPGYVASPGPPPNANWGITGQDDDGNGVVDDFWEAGWANTDDRLSITPMVMDPVGAPDPFNPLRIYPIDPTSSPPDYPRNFALYPLIFSAGPDSKYDINVMGEDPATNAEFRYGNTTPPNNPYYVPSAPAAFPAGVPMDANGDGELSFMDNITNHGIETR